MIAAQPAVIDAPAVLADERRSPLATKALGLAFVSLFPALFWAGFTSLVAQLLGYHLAMTTLGTLATCVALFLTVICAPIILRD